LARRHFGAADDVEQGHGALKPARSSSSVGSEPASQLHDIGRTEMASGQSSCFDLKSSDVFGSLGKTSAPSDSVSEASDSSASNAAVHVSPPGIPCTVERAVASTCFVPSTSMFIGCREPHT